MVDICYPADPGANLPGKEGVEGYDGAVITGSALHVYQRGPHIDPQIELAKAVLAAKTPLFGSCWGLQVITVAAGGSVRRNPKGREIGFGRRIRLTAAGRGHPMYAGKDEVFNAVTVHLDEVEIGRAGHAGAAQRNLTSAVQSAEIRVGEAVAWGTQYHPEYTLGDIAATLRRYGKTLVDDGFFPDESEFARLCQGTRHDQCRSHDQMADLAARARSDDPRQVDPREGNLELDRASGAPDAREARARVRWISPAGMS